MYLYYATAISDFERVVEHWILEEDWSKAIEVINRQVSAIRLYSVAIDPEHRVG